MAEHSDSALKAEEAGFINEAALFLEHESIVLKLTKVIGRPMEALQRNLPERLQAYITKAVDSSIRAALYTAIKTIDQQPALNDWSAAAKRTKTMGRAHTAAAAAAGAVGGFFGAASLPIELPVSTTLILRSIAAIADEWGVDLSDPNAQLECLYIFTLGASAQPELPLQSSYLHSRALFEGMIREAAAFMATKSAREVLQALKKESAPVLLRFVARIAAYFELAVTEKIIVESVPLVGSLGGATINAAFCDYFAKAARYHFGLRALELTHSKEAIERHYGVACAAFKKQH